MSFWEQKKVMVTGGTGFLGSNIVNVLKEKNCKQIIIPRSKEYNLIKECDVNRLFKEYQIDIMIHSASMHGGIDFNIKNKGEIYYKNILMNTFLMEYARRNKVSKFVSIGTVDAYPKYTKIPFREEYIWDGYPEPTSAAYAFSKKMLLVQGKAYQEQYNFNAIHLLLMNLYGPGDEFNLKKCHVIPALIQRIDKAIKSKKNEIIVWGDGSQKREFLHVKDAAKAIVLAAEYYNESDPINVGTGKDISIKEVVNLIASIMGYKGKIKWDLFKPVGNPRKCFDVSKAKIKFNFIANKDFKTELKNTIDWYEKNYKYIR